MTAEASFMAPNIHRVWDLASPKFHKPANFKTYTDCYQNEAPCYIGGMENKVPSRIDRNEAYRRLKADLFRVYQIDLDAYGGIKAAATLLGVSQQQVSNWRKRGLPYWLMVKIDRETKLDASYIYQLGEMSKSERGLESTADAQSELVKQIAQLIQVLRPRRRK